MAGLSLAQEIKTVYPESELTFFATSKRFEEQCITEKGFLFKKLKYTVGRKRSIFQKIRFLTGLAIDTIYSCVVIRRLKPDLIVGLGGYSSVPTVVAAVIMFVPFVLIDQNVIPGKVNRFFSKWAKEVYCHFPEAIKQFKNAKSVVATGNPLRKEIFSVKKDESARSLGLSLKKKTLLILGGSQGATAINETMINCLSEFEKYSDGLQIIHCTGEMDFEEVRKVYDQYAVDAYICTFMSNIETAYSLADVVVSRAGAGTITEITALGLPAILVPYPFAADNHQYFNALEAAKQGAAYLISQENFTVNTAVALITEILMDDNKREKMKARSKSIGKPDAAKAILERIKSLVITTQVYDTNRSGSRFSGSTVGKT